MKIPSTFTKLFVTALFVLGLALPASAEQVPQPFNSVDAEYADWGAEFGDQDVIYNDILPQATQHKKDVELLPNVSHNQYLKNYNGLDMQDQVMPKQQSDSYWMIDEDW